MAPQKLKPFDRVLLDAATANLSDDRGQQLIFDYYKRAGYLPAKDIQGRTFKSLQDYLSTIQRLVEKERLKKPNAKPAEWLKSAEARLGLNRQIRSAKTGRDLAIVASKQLEAPKQKLAKNRVGAVFPLEIGNNGKVVFNKRKYMSAEGGIPRPVYDFIESKHGTEVANTYQKTVRKEWKDMGVAAKELEAKTGIPFERGHWLANKYGGAESARAGSPQIAEVNRLQGDLARGDLGRLKETGRASLGWLDDFYEWDLTTNKLSVPGAEYLNLADLEAISLKEVDPNAMLSKRETEAKLGTLNPDPVGFNFIGTQIDRDQSISQKAQIKKTAVKPKVNLMPNRAALTAMAAGGIAALGPLGTAASAAETAGRTQIAQQTRDPADIAQAAIAGISSLGDVATYNPVTAIPGEVVSTAADVANVVIDKARAPKPKPVQIDQLIPRPKAVMANTSTGVAQLKAMPKSKNIDLVNEAKYFIVNPIRSAFDRVFGKRPI